VVVCLLVRHGAHDLIDRSLCGRTHDIALNGAGQRQAQSLAEHLSRMPVTQIQASPRRRALETAKPVAAKLGLNLSTCDALDEVDFGAWSGQTFEDLGRDLAWRQWNENRASARAPGGESMCEAQARIIAHIKTLHSATPDACVVMITHAEMVRAAALSWLSLPLDAWWRIEVPPASITRIEIGSIRPSQVSTAWRSAP